MEKYKVYVKEGVFLCLVREKQFGYIIEFFISRKYNVDKMVSHVNKEYIPEWFVFESL